MMGNRAAYRALSVRQPWASLIVYAGQTIENREWPTRYRGPLLIHAAQARPSAAEAAAIHRWLRERGLPSAAALAMPYGAVIGVVDLVDCVCASADPWFVGTYGFVLANARPLAPFPLRGERGLFAVFGPRDLLDHAPLACDLPPRPGYMESLTVEAE